MLQMREFAPFFLKYPYQGIENFQMWFTLLGRVSPSAARFTVRLHGSAVVERLCKNKPRDS